MPAEYPQASGGGGGAAALTHPHPVLEAVWTIVHGLGFHPNVAIEDSGGSDVLADIDYPNLNTVTITFLVPITGTAYLS